MHAGAPGEPYETALFCHRSGPFPKIGALEGREFTSKSGSGGNCVVSKGNPNLADCLVPVDVELVIEA